MVFQRNLSESNSLLVFGRNIRILADLNNTEVWMVLILRLISNPSPLFPSLWGSFKGHNSNRNDHHPHVPVLLSSQARSKYLSIFFVFFPLYSGGTVKSTPFLTSMLDSLQWFTVLSLSHTNFICYSVALIRFLDQAVLFFRCFSFLTFYSEHGTFFSAEFHCWIF